MQTLAWLAGHPHSTADAIGAGLRERVGAVSTQAVYDMLAACTTAGLLRRTEPAGRAKQNAQDPKAAEQANPARTGMQAKA